MHTFNEFWLAYPRKVAKKTAFRAWERMTVEERVSAIKALPNHLRAWRGKDLKFVPYPASWLNAGRWDDELIYEEAPNLTSIERFMQAINVGGSNADRSRTIEACEGSIREINEDVRQAKDGSLLGWD